MSQRWGVTCKECHGPAFVVLGELPKPSDVVMAARCEHLDGRPMVGSDPLVCDTCGIDFTRTGVEPSTAWRLLPELFAEPHTPQDAPWGTHADPRDVASVRLAIQTFQPTKRPRAPRKRAVRKETA